MNTPTAQQTNQQNAMTSLMTDDEDVRQSLSTILGEDLAHAPLQELTQKVNDRVTELEQDLNTTGTFGMAELEHGMLTKLLAQLLGGQAGSASVH